MASRDTREAVRRAIGLGDVYLGSDSYSDALEYYLQAAGEGLRSRLSPVELGELYVRMARCHFGLGSYDDARACCDKVGDLDLGEGDRTIAAEADVVLSRVEIESGHYKAALECAQRAYDALKSLPDSEFLAEASNALGIANAELGNIDAARDYFTDYLVCQKRLGNEGGLAHAYNNLAILSKRAGELNGALKDIERALEIDQKLGRSAAVARGLGNMGTVLYKLSRWTEAEERLNEARQIYTRIGAVRYQVAVENSLGNICRARREWGRAAELFEDVLAKSRENGYLRAEALALEFRGELEMDQGQYGVALKTLDGALAAAYRLSPESDVVGEALRRRAEVLFELGRLAEAERDCSQALRLSRKLGDKVEEGATLRVLARICYAKAEPTAAEALISQAEGILRKVGESFELARCALVDGVGLRESQTDGGLPVEQIEARLSTAASLFTQMGASYWVALCELERGKALSSAGQPDRSRAWLERARLKFEVGNDEQGLAEVEAILKELDAQLATAGVSREGRYTVIAKGYEFLETTEPRPDDLHRLATEIADAVSVDRLVLASKVEGGGVLIAMSVDLAGGGVTDAVKFMRTAVEDRGHTRPLIVSAGPGGSVLPSGAGAVALIPVATRRSGDTIYLLYAERSRKNASVAFAQSDVEFLGAAGRLLGLTHSRIGESVAWRAEEELAQELKEAPQYSGLITRNAQMNRILADVERLKDSRVPVLIKGESGVGKELVARAIHRDGRGRTGDFIALNAGAIAPHLQESELFGHVKGAFTDAHHDREGLVAAAAGGTLLLDEVGEMSPALQIKLLRFLQDGEYRRVGENVSRMSDARVISATNKDLMEEVRAGRFRRDLLYRLCTVVMEVPPLRDRPDDVPILIEHFLELYSKREGKRIVGFSREVRELFSRHDWRGNNVRELENEVRRGVALCADGEEIGIDKLSPEIRERYESGLRSDTQRTLRDEVQALEKSRILDALEKTGWNRKSAADLLGLSRTGLLAKMKKYGIG